MKIRGLQLALVIPTIILGSVFITSALGIWQTSNNKVPAKFKEGIFTGQYNPADIRGSYTFADISKSFEVPLEDLGKAFGVKDPANYAAFQCKELEKIYGVLAAEGKEVGTSSVKYFVALYKDLPFTLTETIYLPQAAVDILKRKTQLTSEQISSLEKYAVNLPADTPVATTLPPKTPTGAIAVERTLKGNTTFKELLDWGITHEAIEKAINAPLPNTSQSVKDYAASKGIGFGALKERLQELIDKNE